MKFLRFITAVLVFALAAAWGASESETAVPPEGMVRAREARGLFEKGDYRGAEKIYAALAQEFPRNLYFVSNLGVVRFRAGKLKAAEEALLRAVAIKPEDGFSLCTLGMVYYTEGRLDEAVNQLTKALAIDPGNAAAHNYLGLVAAGKGWTEAAQKEFETARKLDPAYEATPDGNKDRGDFPTPREREMIKVPDEPAPAGARPLRTGFVPTFGMMQTRVADFHEKVESLTNVSDTQSMETRLLSIAGQGEVAGLGIGGKISPVWIDYETPLLRRDAPRRESRQPMPNGDFLTPLERSRLGLYRSVGE